MKNIFSVIFSLFFLSAYAQHSDLNVEISNLNSLKGKVMIALYNSDKGFPKENEFKSIVVKPLAKKFIQSFKNIPHGTYAVAILHDENENGKMDIGMLGPKEGYGFSNDARGFMSAPSFDKASFKHSGNQKIKITIK